MGLSLTAVRDAFAVPDGSLVVSRNRCLWQDDSELADP